MKPLIYNKLVRDNIPDIIKSKGCTPYTRVLGKEEYICYLEQKLLEEIQEYMLSGNIEELVDIYEVILAILDNKSVSFETFEKMRQSKAEKNGQFKMRILLSSVQE